MIAQPKVLRIVDCAWSAQDKIIYHFVENVTSMHFSYSINVQGKAYNIIYRCENRYHRVPNLPYLGWLYTSGAPNICPWELWIVNRASFDSALLK